jgi:hypothetical protein
LESFILLQEANVNFFFLLKSRNQDRDMKQIFQFFAFEEKAIEDCFNGRNPCMYIRLDKLNFLHMLHGNDTTCKLVTSLQVL